MWHITLKDSILSLIFRKNNVLIVVHLYSQGTLKCKEFWLSKFICLLLLCRVEESLFYVYSTLRMTTLPILKLWDHGQVWKLINISQWFEVIFYTKPCRPAHETKDLEEKNIVVNMVLIVSSFEGLGVVFRMETQSCDI